MKATFMEQKRPLVRKIVALISLFGALAVFAIGGIYYHFEKSSRPVIYSSQSVPPQPVALVLGARVNANGTPSDMLRDRLDVAVELYRAGKAEKILMSGDHGQEQYDEVNVAKKYLLEKGVAPEDLFLDHAGFDTYDSVYRARDVFGARSLIIVTQGYHLPRALYIAQRLGVEAVGTDAALHAYGGEDYRQVREVAADAKAYLNVLFRSRPRYLGEAIPWSGDGRRSWD
jgi:SanA protein